MHKANSRTFRCIAAFCTGMFMQHQSLLLTKTKALILIQDFAGS